ncbi:hypothetical protein FOCG_18207 [Fusarium oxysporum f. sp. radicis-lycopersici 26381]|nr:hypothetical protein FOCG_18207 [Fusarium oxysporum f. sp. radicis-lycopersici 26381]
MGLEMRLFFFYLFFFEFHNHALFSLCLLKHCVTCCGVNIGRTQNHRKIQVATPCAKRLRFSQVGNLQSLHVHAIGDYIIYRYFVLLVASLPYRSSITVLKLC